MASKIQLFFNKFKNTYKQIFYMYIMDHQTTNERNIINEMIELNEKFVDFLYYLKNNIKIINNKINEIDNYFFTDNLEISHHLYNYDHIDEIINNINFHTNQLHDKLGSCCEKHNFIDDYIDTSFGDNIKIRYCTVCGVSKK